MVKEIREKKGLSQDELAKKANVSRATISGLESGRIIVTTTSTLRKIANGLDASIDDIFSSDHVV